MTEQINDESEALEGITITCNSGILRNKTKFFDVRISGHKEKFLLTDALARHSNFPDLGAFIETKLRALTVEYLSRAAEIVSKASNLANKTQK